MTKISNLSGYIFSSQYLDDYRNGTNHLALVLDGIYPVDVWVTALAWEEFRILFYRNCSKSKQYEIVR